MKGVTAGVLTAGIALSFAGGVAEAQKWTGSVPLGDLARQLKAQRAKSTKKPRMFTNDDLVALGPASELLPPSDPTAASADNKSNQEAGAGQIVENRAIPVELGKATPGEDYIDRMSKVRVVRAEPGKEKSSSSSLAKLAPHPDTQQTPAAVRIRQIAAAEATIGWAKAKSSVSAETAQAAEKAPEHPDPPAAEQAVQADLSGPYGEWAKAKYRAAQGAGSASVEPGPVAAPAINSPAPPREDLGYVERADGKVEAIVAEGQHIGLIQETKEFMKNFHIPAPSPAELEMALAPPSSNPPEAAVPEADQPSEVASAPDAGIPAAENATDVAQLQQPQAPPADNAPSQPEATLQAEPLADYAGTQVRPAPPENLQPASAPAFATTTPDAGANRSTVSPIGYVEKAGGEKEAIVTLQDQVFLVHEGELFAGKYRALKVTALAVEIVEEPSEASSAAIDRPRGIQVAPAPR